MCLPLRFWQGQKDSNPRHVVLEWMWESAARSREEPVLPDFCRKYERGWCWFGAGRKFSEPKQAKKSGKSRKSRKHIDLNRQRPYNKKCRDHSRRGVCCRQAVSHSLTLHREGVMRMGHKGCGVRALRFVICVVAALAVAIALAPKAC